MSFNLRFFFHFNNLSFITLHTLKYIFNFFFFFANFCLIQVIYIVDFLYCIVILFLLYFFLSGCGIWIKMTTIFLDWIVSKVSWQGSASTVWLSLRRKVRGQRRTMTGNKQKIFCFKADVSCMLYAQLNQSKSKPSKC